MQWRAMFFALQRSCVADFHGTAPWDFQFFLPYAHPASLWPSYEGLQTLGGDEANLWRRAWGRAE